MAVFDLPRWSEHPDLVEFYTRHRNCPEDLYPSERRFLPWLAHQVVSVLDTGCAAGGFRNIWNHYNPNIIYSGVDISASLIEAAKRLHPRLRFFHGNLPQGINLPDRYATVVQALGWLNWEPEYARAIAELWRLTDKFLFLDVRLVGQRDALVIGKQKLALAGEWDGETTTPYVTVSWTSFAPLLLNLRPTRLLGYGYWGRPAETVTGVSKQVCFAAFVLERASHGECAELPTICVDLPIPWPPELSGQVELLPSDRLVSLAPGG